MESSDELLHFHVPRLGPEGDTDLETPMGPISDGNWHHVAVTNNGTVATLYVDGASADTDNTPSPGVVPFVNTRITISVTPDAPDVAEETSVVGSMDDLLIMPGALSEAAITMLANAGIGHAPVADGTTCNDGDDEACDQCVAGECSGESVDTDQDGTVDCTDLCAGHNDTADSDNDNVPDGCDTESCDNVDNNGDGVNNENFANDLANPCEYGTGVCKVLVGKDCKTDGSGVDDCPTAPPRGRKRIRIPVATASTAMAARCVSPGPVLRVRHQIAPTRTPAPPIRATRSRMVAIIVVRPHVATRPPTARIRRNART